MRYRKLKQFRPFLNYLIFLNEFFRFVAVAGAVFDKIGRPGAEAGATKKGGGSATLIYTVKGYFDLIAVNPNPCLMYWYL